MQFLQVFFQFLIFFFNYKNIYTYIYIYIYIYIYLYNFFLLIYQILDLEHNLYNQVILQNQLLNKNDQYLKAKIKIKFLFFKLYNNNMGVYKYNIIQYLSKKQKNYIEINCDDMYFLFVKKQQQVHENLLKYYEYVKKKCITEKQKQTFKKFLQPPQNLINAEYIINETTTNNQNIDKQNDLNYILQNRYKTTDPENITHAILNESNLIGIQILQIWYKCLDLFKISPQYCLYFFNLEYQKEEKERNQIYIIKQNPSTNQVSEQNEKTAQKTRQKIQNYQFKGIRKIEQIQPSIKPENHPLIFEETIIKKEDKINKKNIKEQIHLFILVHGFQGNSFDMKVFRNYLTYLYPESLFLSSNCNEDSTVGDIQEMGKNLANEIINFIQETCQVDILSRISFIGFSLGGIIIRAALPYLEDYSQKMYSFITLSSPHLGFMYNSNIIIEAGLWFLKRWKKSECLQQLSLTDHNEIEECFLYKLSQYKGIGWFKNICLASSFQDRYAPFDSARIQLTKEGLNSEKGKRYTEMTKNILDQINADFFNRLDVHFDIQERNFDTIIGRTAHIQFIECQYLIKLIVSNYDILLK
ncbi:serine esterase, putative [Ichthyophthirius multifiliis]|uniref:Serine esterase, putative n=1 Tax=Ichthyophthirius multifiliis TaxID=5932 RepID=G0QXR3_ICHMU|nr:serine esterase, putative [Ichthyophthirius multifiliis]EGR30000.1 serine esterase, putative [Ichthyophthirius multifiliis]|eukprot:XP_004031236.1 serine esterase, putative [Ichthyophthirius multifiliis]